MYKIFFLFLVSPCLVYSKHEEYLGHVLYEVRVANENQGSYLNEVVERFFLDKWHPTITGQDSLILVPGDLKEDFQKEMIRANIAYEVKSDNIKEQLDLEDQLLSAAAARSNRSSPTLPYDVIHRYDVVNNYLQTVANSYANVRIATAGKTAQGRDIRYLRISSDNFQSRNKPVVFLMSLLHAREWVTLPGTLYAIEKLVIDVQDRSLVNNIDWIIMPIANPDGYEFTHTNTRMWRKNRRQNSGWSFCPGVDLNRNFDHQWGTASSSSPCSDTYHGTGPFSEPETAAVRNVLNEVRNRLELFIDLHSFGSMILYGFGNRQLPPNALTLNMVGVRMAQRIDAVKWRDNRNYRVGNIVDLLNYGASGGSSDYVQSLGNLLSYTYEMPAYRNQNTLNGFLVDPAFIYQAGMETWEGIKAGARYLIERRDAAMAR
ncbi:carboxypeptidase B-like [Pieris rapae]|uniref:carboxypeptidase B-like n=1 Tax=Pieris rapae TaxID=64459 RepID=UPI001E27CD96|nr:carboxypeptidase B-like [Pieris rapae]